MVEQVVDMWIFKYFICLLSRHHLWIGSLYKYCVRCGKIELERADSVLP